MFHFDTATFDFGLSTVAAALGIAQMAARLSGFSIERLPRLLLRLDREIEIAVRPKREEQARVRVA